MKLAYPSYVIPKSTRENIEFLCNKTNEIALLAFEPSLPYLQDLQSFKGKWHVHLPYLIPNDFYTNSDKYCKENVTYTEKTKWFDVWKLAHTKKDIEEFTLSCIKIIKHCTPLNLQFAVMHLPNASLAHAKTFLKVFLETWEQYLPLSMLCLENVRNASYLQFNSLLSNIDCSYCFDIAHALTYNQTNLLNYPFFMEKVKIIHWSSPYEINTKQNGKDKHLGLYHLKNQKKYCINVLKNTPNTAIHVLELFSWEEIQKSLPFFQNLFH